MNAILLQLYVAKLFSKVAHVHKCIIFPLHV